MPKQKRRSDPKNAFNATVIRLLRARPPVEVRRLEFLEERVTMLDEADRVARLVQHLRSCGPDDKTPKTMAFLEWADGHVGSLRDSCRPAEVEDDLVRSKLW